MHTVTFPTKTEYQQKSGAAGESIDTVSDQVKVMQKLTISLSEDSSNPEVSSVISGKQNRKKGEGVLR